MEKGDLHQMDDAGAITGTPSFYERLTYADARGNIATLKRSGLYPTSGGCFATGLFDNLTYSYAAGTNRLRDISDAASSSIRTHGYKYYNVSGGDYGYDANGNITYDPSKGITITYNYLNKATLIDFGSGKKIEYIYDAGGTKLTKTVKLSNAVQYYQHYPSSTSGQVGGIEYRQNPVGNAEIEALYHSEGRVAYTAGTNPKYEYTLRDHLGNTRLTFCDLNGDGAVQTPSEILQENHYYAFSLSLHGPWMNAAAPDNLYQYSGKELQPDHGLGWLDFGARMYMPEAGRFTTIDRFSEKYYSLAPYQYAANNPVLFTDVNGDSIWTSSRYTQANNGRILSITHTIHATGKILYEGNVGASQIATDLNTRLNSQKKVEIIKNPDGTTMTVNYEFAASFSGATSMDNVLATDHLIVIVEDVLGGSDPSLGGGPAGGIAEVGGQIAYVEKSSSQTAMVENAFHELGHNMGLIHPITNEPHNPMSYHPTGDGADYSLSQMKNIVQSDQNRGTNSVSMGTMFSTMRENTWGKSTNERPFRMTPSQRFFIPRPVKNPIKHP